MAAVKPLKLKQERARPGFDRALTDPIVEVLVDHQIIHLDQHLEYLVPEHLSASAVVGTLVEVELSHHLTQGIVVARYENPVSGGELKPISKVLSDLPYVLPDLIASVQTLSQIYGASEWDFIRSMVPPFSKMGERASHIEDNASDKAITPTGTLPSALVSVLAKEEKFSFALQLPTAKPYWRILSEIVLERLKVSTVLLLVPNERELLIFQDFLITFGIDPICIKSAEGKSQRYANYLRSRSKTHRVIIGTRSSVLLSLPENAAIVLFEDGDESHYERKSPTWNSREVVTLREKKHSVIYASASLSLEIAQRITEGSLPLFKFPEEVKILIKSANASGESGYFELISQSLRKGSVLISMGLSGYVTSFSCQKCRNVALCTCGGKLYIPKAGKAPECATCATVYIGWSCIWCGESKPRAVTTGVMRRAEEFGKAFPGQSIVTSSAADPKLFLPEGRHLVISTPGVEPRGIYSAIIILDLEGKLLRTTLRATEEVRLHLMRTATMVDPQGVLYLDLIPSDSFLQSILRGNPLLAAQREIEERTAVGLPPLFSAVIVASDDLEAMQRVLGSIPEILAVGPFIRGKRKALLLKVPRELKQNLITLLAQVNRVQSLRKEPLLTYQIDPYSLN